MLRLRSSDWFGENNLWPNKKNVCLYGYKKLRPIQRLCAFKNNGLRMKRRNFRILFYLSFPLRNHVLNTTMCAK